MSSTDNWSLAAKFSFSSARIVEMTDNFPTPTTLFIHLLCTWHSNLRLPPSQTGKNYETLRILKKLKLHFQKHISMTFLHFVNSSHFLGGGSKLWYSQISALLLSHGDFV